jgi:hypothetical protein
MGKRWEKFKPAVNRSILVLIAGSVWAMVGLMLSRLAILWWERYTGSFLVLFIILGLILGIVKGYFVFSRVVKKNISRIARMDDTGFILAFIPWQTYLLITGMILLGIALRHSELPKQYLAILYLGVGLAMILSSLQYFGNLVRGELKNY